MDAPGVMENAATRTESDPLVGGDTGGDGAVHAGGIKRTEKPGWLPANPRVRGDEKLRALLLWLCRFHYSNRSVLMVLLNLNHFSNTSYFTRLIEKGILKEVTIVTLRRPVLMLTPAGLSLLEGVPEAAHYSLDERRIAPSLARHALAVQRAVLARRVGWSEVTPERLMRERGKKIPDALLTSHSGKVALEVELTYKTQLKIYLGFADHARAVRDGVYQRVEYVFTDPVMRDYYQGLFDAEKWPVYRWDSKARHYNKQDSLLIVDSIAGLRAAVTFTVEELPHD